MGMREWWGQRYRFRSNAVYLWWLLGALTTTHFTWKSKFVSFIPSNSWNGLNESCYKHLFKNVLDMRIKSLGEESHETINRRMRKAQNIGEVNP